MVTSPQANKSQIAWSFDTVYQCCIAAVAEKFECQANNVLGKVFECT